MNRFYLNRRSTWLIAMISLCYVTSAQGQVRSKQQDRGTYQSPILDTVELESFRTPASSLHAKSRPATTRHSKALRPTGDQELDLINPEWMPESTQRLSLPARPQATPRRVERRRDETYIDGSRDEPAAYHDNIVIDGPILQGASGAEFMEGGVFYDSGCDGLGCDSYGCDSMGCSNSGCSNSGWANSFISLSSDRWFGSIELLLMYRKGDRPPTLLTTGPNEDQADSQVLFGGDSILKDVTAGGRLTLGTYIDDACCRSLVLRGWFAGQETAHFKADQFSNPVLGRPFLNVSDGQTPDQDISIIASPGRADGMVMIDASSNVFGADVSVRQNFWGGCGASIDLLYGYQFMRLEEDLRINASTVSLDDDFAPLGSLIEISDRFDTSNEFHGAQFGLASRYREGCWSFNTLAKVGFGSLLRKAVRTGNTTTSSGGLSASDPQGLLVRATNSGTVKNRTFGWVPELDLTLGYHRFPRYDVTIGYHVIAMTDALQASGAIDPNLASNLSDPATGAQNPSRALRYGTYYVQGIHFGLQYVY